MQHARSGPLSQELVELARAVFGTVLLRSHSLILLTPPPALDWLLPSGTHKAASSQLVLMPDSGLCRFVGRQN